jgi:hypothetical protein
MAASVHGARRGHKPFNVTVIHPQGYPHALGLKEAADYVTAVLRACGFASARTINQLAENAHNVVFCAHLLPREQVAKLPQDSIIFNSEQLDDVAGGHFRSGVYRELLQRFFIWDYSPRNLPRVPHDNKCVIPFLYCADLVRADIARVPGDTLLFYGSMTARRQRILEDLRRRGVRVDGLFGEYGDGRDLKIARSWAVLNIHKSDTAVAFEPIRCFYPLINGVPVISEDVSDESTLPFRDSMFFLDQLSFVDRVAALYEDAHTFRDQSRSMLAAFKRTSPAAEVMHAVGRFLERWK